jgi:hypothetical protein
MYADNPDSRSPFSLSVDWLLMAPYFQYFTVGSSSIRYTMSSQPTNIQYAAFGTYNDYNLLQRLLQSIDVSTIGICEVYFLNPKTIHLGPVAHRVSIPATIIVLMNDLTTVKSFTSPKRTSLPSWAVLVLPSRQPCSWLRLGPQLLLGYAAYTWP